MLGWRGRQEEFIKVVICGLGGLVLGGFLMTVCTPAGSEVWIVERDVPQTRNLIPILNRTTVITSGPSEKVICALNWKLREPNVRKGRFWPEFGSRARMALPISVPDNFPVIEPRILDKPEISIAGEDAVLRWSPIELEANSGAVAHADVWLGPPDMYHTADGLRFGDIVIETDYAIEIPGEGSDSVKIVCRLTLRNTHSEPVEGLEFAFFFPRALLDTETGSEIPLVGSFRYEAQGFSDPYPLDLLISDGLGRGAWGPRFTIEREKLNPGESHSCSVEVTGTILEDEALIVPLISLVARIQARYWASSEIEVSPTSHVHYSDYTHFNLVIADSRLFRFKDGNETVEMSSPEVRQYLGTGQK